MCRQYILYPDYRVTKKEMFVTKRNERAEKEVMLNELRKDLASCSVEVKRDVKYHVSLPSEEAHHSTHPTRGPHLMAQRVNPQIIQHINDLVLEGLTNPYEVRKALNNYVRKVLCPDNPPDSDDRAYFPVNRDLKNHIYKAKRALELSKFDQHNLAMKITEWKVTYPDSHHFFRPYVSSQKNQDHVRVESELDETMDVYDSEDDGLKKSAGEFEQTLMWVHQTKWQQDILSKYGNTMTLIDATYKTTLYDLALFFITVRTNAGYMVAAEFIIQTETSEQIKEALSILKSWNPKWSPSFFMSDYSEAEILGVESVFPQTQVYLCDFHREQSWERWIKDSKHGLAKEDGESLLNLLRQCANAPPALPQDGKEQDFFYKQALMSLQQSNVWRENAKVKGWLTNKWLSIPKV